MPEEFALEPSEPGVVPERVISELRNGHRIAKDYGSAFGEALKAQAEKYNVAPGALRRYVAALNGDKLDDAAKEATDLVNLLAAGS